MAKVELVVCTRNFQWRAPFTQALRTLAGCLVAMGVASNAVAAPTSQPPPPPALPRTSLPGPLAESPVLRKLRISGVIAIGYRTASPPFSYLDKAQRPIGYTIDLCSHIVTQLRKRPGLADLEVRYVAVNSSTRLPMAANGAVDLECGATTNSLERQNSVAFSVTTYVAEVRLLAPRAAGIDSLSDLQGKVVATTIGTTSVGYLQDANEKAGLRMRILLGLDDAEALAHVIAGRAQAFAMDDVLLMSSASTLSDASNWKMSSQRLSIEPYGIPMTRHDPEFKAIVDAALTDLYRSGRIRDIYGRWFQSPIPPRGVNLRLPLSPVMEKVFQQPTDSADPAAYR